MCQKQKEELVEGQTTVNKYCYYINPKTSFWSRIILIILLLSSVPALVFKEFGDDWFKAIFGSGLYFTGCLGLIAFLLKNYWDGSRKRFNTLCVLENEIVLQITTIQDTVEKMELMINRDIPILTTSTLVEPDLSILYDIARIEIKNDAFNTLSRIADLKAALDFHSKTWLEQLTDSGHSMIKSMAMEKFKEQKMSAEGFVNELRKLDVRVKFFIKNDCPFWIIPIPFFSKNEYAKYLNEQPILIEKYLAEKNKDKGPSFK